MNKRINEYIYMNECIYVHIYICETIHTYTMHMSRLDMTERLHKSCYCWALQDAAPEPKKGAKARGLS